MRGESHHLGDLQLPARRPVALGRREAPVVLSLGCLVRRLRSPESLCRRSWVHALCVSTRRASAPPERRGRARRPQGETVRGRSSEVSVVESIDAAAPRALPPPHRKRERADPADELAPLVAEETAQQVPHGDDSPKSSTCSRGLAEAGRSCRPRRQSCPSKAHVCTSTSSHW